MPRIALIPGDGIGAEVVREAELVLNEVARVEGLDVVCDRWDLGADRYLRDGVTITDEEFARLSDEYEAVLLGALGDPRVPGNEHARDILLGMRFRLDLYVNFRPCTLLLTDLSPLKGARAGMQLDIFRENTEGVYTGLGGRFKAGTPDEVAIEEDVNTYRGVERIVRAAFEHARERGRPRVTLVDKANAMRNAGALWRRVFEEVGSEYDVPRDAMYVDAMAMDLVRRPETYSVIVTSNLFGDIVSDLAAEITGGIGLAPSAQLHPGRIALFEPVHGSAPDIAGQGVANPLAAIRCVALMLEHFDHPGAASRVEAAVRASLGSDIRTRDLGGQATTEEVGRWVVDHLSAPVGRPSRAGAVP